MKYIGITFITLGVLLVYGTAGSSDLGLITLKQMAARTAIGLSFIGVGTLLLRIYAETKK
jgi:hypothetical protein